MPFVGWSRTPKRNTWRRNAHKESKIRDTDIGRETQSDDVGKKSGKHSATKIMETEKLGQVHTEKKAGGDYGDPLEYHRRSFYNSENILLYRIWRNKKPYSRKERTYGNWGCNSSYEWVPKEAEKEGRVFLRKYDSTLRSVRGSALLKCRILCLKINAVQDSTLCLQNREGL